MTPELVKEAWMTYWNLDKAGKSTERAFARFKRRFATFIEERGFTQKEGAVFIYENWAGPGLYIAPNGQVLERLP